MRDSESADNCCRVNRVAAVEGNDVAAVGAADNRIAGITGAEQLDAVYGRPEYCVLTDVRPGLNQDGVAMCRRVQALLNSRLVAGDIDDVPQCNR